MRSAWTPANGNRSPRRSTSTAVRLLPQLLTPEEAEEIRGLYDVDDAFRQTVNMGRVRFGEG